ncbi:GGDEF domain-containing protein [Actinoplanes sp. NEAU-A12]|uniref:GGDEF domain-containing protein n=1 Tax=Actinoplanes sandaracinus TaxID=3045177 RepID=A0ABT6WCB5_9ACTN|nr:GGDEF domain-containing protein [Actinoplanes sandaracinus]MDI6097392.1 GGDEF domain-containing protein [Actinoplanes sandaracinus]
MSYRIWPRLVAILVAGLVLQTALPEIPHRAGLVVGSVPVAVAGCFAVAGFVRLARRARGRLCAGWAVGGLSAGLLAASYALYTADAILGRAPSTPNLPDLLSLGAAAVAIVALLLVSPPMSGVMARLTVVLDVATVGGALLLLAWQLVLSEVVAALAPATRLMFLTTAALEIGGAAVALVLMSRTAPTANGYALRLLSGGLGTFAVTAIIAVYNRAEGLPWHATGAGAGYLVAALLIALSSRTALPVADSTGRKVFSGVWPLLPYVPAVLAVVEVIRVYVRTGTLPPLVMWLLLAAITMAMLRQLLMLVTIRRLMTGLHHQAHHDALTGLPNRVAFHTVAEAELASAPDGRCTAVLLLDLDGFKLVNDTLGHAAGDALLVTVAGRFGAALRPGDTAARLGGDEFVVLLPDLAAPEQADEIARRLLDGIGMPMTLADREHRVRASIGVAVCHGGGHDLDRLLQRADSALYRAKNAGKGTFRRYGAEAAGEPGTVTVTAA